MTNDNSKKHVSFTNALAWRLILLIVLLVPLALASIWAVKRSGHGAPAFCSIDPEGKFATFGWIGAYRSIRLSNLEPVADLRSRTIDLVAGGVISGDEGPVPWNTLNWVNSWAIAVRGKDRFEVLDWSVDPRAESKRFHFSFPKTAGFESLSMVLVNGCVLVSQVGETSSRIVMIDPRSNDIEVLDESSSGANELLLSVRGDLFSIWGSTANTNRTMLVRKFGRLIDGKLRFIGNWGSEYLGCFLADETDKPKVVTQSLDGKSFEVRDATTNQLLQSIGLPLTAVLSSKAARTDTIVGDSWVSIGAPSPTITWDLSSGSVLPVPNGQKLVARSHTSKRLVVATQDELAAQLINEQSGEVVARVPIQGRLARAAFVADGNQVWFADAGQRLILHDATTGQVLRIVDPLWFIPYLELLTAVGFFIWACAWLHSAAKVHRQAWFDCAWLSGLSIGYVILRSHLCGFPGEVTRPIYQFSEGIFACWLILSSLWLVLGRTRFSLRVLPQIGVSGLAVLFSLVCVGFENARVWELIIAVGLMSLWLVAACLPLRLMGYRFMMSRSNGNVETNSLRKGAVPIRDLFLLTTVLAGLMALGRFAPPVMPVTVQLIANLFVLVVSVTMTGLAAARVGLSRQTLIARVASLLVVAGVGMTLPLVWTAIYQGWQVISEPDIGFLWWQLRLHGSTAIATTLCLYAFRLRGWRLTRGIA